MLTTRLVGIIGAAASCAAPTPAPLPTPTPTPALEPTPAPALEPTPEPAESHGWLPGQDWANCAEINLADASGAPVVRGNVTYRIPVGSGIETGTTYLTDTRGRVCEPDFLAGGTIEVTAPNLLGGACGAKKRIRLPPWDPSSGPPMTPITIAIDRRPPITLSSRVVSSSGAAIANAEVSLNGHERDSESCSEGFEIWATTDSRGRFEFAALPSGIVTIAIRHSKYVDGEFRLPLDGTQRKLVLEKGATLRGQVIAPDGTVMSRCRIYPESMPAIDCAPGGFSFEGLRPGPLKLRIRIDDATWGNRGLKATVVIKGAEARIEDIVWPPGQPIGGQLVDSAGTPLTGVPVAAVPKGAQARTNRAPPGQVRVRTDEQGRFRFRDLASGTWTIHHKKVSIEAVTGSENVELVAP